MSRIVSDAALSHIHQRKTFLNGWTGLKQNRVSTFRMPSSFGVLKQGIFPESLPLVGGLCFAIHRLSLWSPTVWVGVALHGDPDPKCRAGVLLFLLQGHCHVKIEFLRCAFQFWTQTFGCVKLCVPGPNCVLSLPPERCAFSQVWRQLGSSGN